jgi:hypothetical protein
MTPATYNINTLVSSNTFEAINFTLTDGATPTPNPIVITGASIKWTVKATKDSANFIIQRTTTNSGITITNGAAGQFTLNKINDFTVPEGDYIHEVEITFTNGERKTYIRGALKVLYKLA